MTIEEFKQKYKQEIANACLKMRLTSGVYALAMDQDGCVFVHKNLESIKLALEAYWVWHSEITEEVQVYHNEPEFKKCSDWNTNYAIFELKVTAEVI